MTIAVVFAFTQGIAGGWDAIREHYGATQQIVDPVYYRLFVEGWLHEHNHPFDRVGSLTEQESSVEQVKALHSRLSDLSSAILRISASLDLPTVLREVVDSARALTDARYGIITTVDEDGAVCDFVTSGLTAGERAQLASWPEGPQLFAYFRNLDSPIRVNDLSAYVRSLGFSSDLIFADSFLGTPMRHRGENVGLFFLAGKNGETGFTTGDEEILVLFAAQAAAAISNARTYRAERRARADLEALVDTSPVGVVVFDARTGNPVSFNREARRIVERLRSPGHPLEALLELVTCHRSDGREVSLAEIPLVQTLNSGETVRFEEIVLSVPDGRSVTVLLNSTPIRSDDDSVTSVVATMQDLAPVQERERQQAEFLGLVSHELHVPLMSIKGSAATLLGTAAELAPAELRAFHRIIDNQSDHMRGLIVDLLDAGRIGAGTLTVEPEPSDVALLVDRARSAFLSRASRHDIVVDLPPDLPAAMADRRRVIQVLNNLLSNAARNSPNSSPIRITASRDGVHVAISVTDKGKGISPEQLPLLFRKHVSPADGDAEAGALGSGLGLSICKGLVEAHGGRIRAESNGVGQGSTLTFTLPVSEEEGGRAVVPRSMSSSPRSGPVPILVVDDDPETLRFVRGALTEAGYAPVLTSDPGEVPSLIAAERPKLVLLDLMFPDTDGIELMTSVPALEDVPVIFISAYGRDETIARALDAGATDYIVKPFSPTELTARVGAALRKLAEPKAFVLGDLVVDYEQRRVSLAGRPVRLTVKEYELLRLLSLNAGRVTTSKSILRQLWGEKRSFGSDPVRNFVKKLRNKLGDDAGKPAMIYNERGVGYRMPKPDDLQPRTDSERYDSG